MGRKSNDSVAATITNPHVWVWLAPRFLAARQASFDLRQSGGIKIGELTDPRVFDFLTTASEEVLSRRNKNRKEKGYDAKHKAKDVEAYKKYHREWRRKKYYSNVETSRERARTYAKKTGGQNLEVHREKARENYKKKIAKDPEYNAKQWAKLTPEKKEAAKAAAKDWRTKNRERYLSGRREYRAKNLEKCRQKTRENYAKNKAKYLAVGAAYKKARLKTDVEFRLKERLRGRVASALRSAGAHKVSSFINLVGCSSRELKAHLEGLFKTGMSWENYGYRGWHVDHIVPCAAFDLTKVEEQRKCFHYANLQPLWAKENLSKSAKIVTP